MKDPEDTLKEMHTRYCALTGLDLRYPIHRNTWLQYWQASYTVEDLELVIPFVLRHNAKGEWQYSLQLRTLIGDLEKFDDLRAQAIKQASLRKPNYNKNVVLAATGRPPELPGSCKTAKEVIVNLADEMRKAAG